MKHITVEQRYTISVMKQQGYKQREIAEAIGKDKSVISRELKRNSDKRSKKYNWDQAHRKAEGRKKEKPHIKKFTLLIKERIDSMLAMDYSPEQIVGRLKRKGVYCVSHERIYQYIWDDKRRGGQLYLHLRRKGRKYRKRGSAKDSRGIIKDRVDISKRPAIVDEKIRFGDLEIDTIIGKNHKGAILTINDRLTSKVWIKKLSGKDARELADKTIETLLPYKNMIKTITADNGKEFAEHLKIASALNVSVYFARPYHSWERGANENTNGLIRQYIPKGTDFETIDQQYIKDVEDILNNRPRKKLAFLSPNEFFVLFLSNKKVAFAA